MLIVVRFHIDDAVHVEIIQLGVLELEFDFLLGFEQLKHQFAIRLRFDLAQKVQNVDIR